jgi:hypothetical protein
VLFVSRETGPFHVCIPHADVWCACAVIQGGLFGSNNGDSRSNGKGRTTNLRNVLLDYVARADPSEVQDFLQAASTSPAITAAMKQTVSNMVGTLPPAHFQVTIDTVSAGKCVMKGARAEPWELHRRTPKCCSDQHMPLTCCCTVTGG